MFSKKLQELALKFQNEKIDTNLNKKVIYNTLLEETSFLPLDSKRTPIARRFWHILNNTREIPKCICSKECTWNYVHKTYNTFCGRECSAKNKENTKKRIKGILEKYGIDNVSKLDSIKEKKKETLMNNYGVENPSQSRIVREKKEHTSLERYGTKHHLQNKDILKKQIQTNLEKYGVSNNAQKNIPDKCFSILNSELELSQFITGISDIKVIRNDRNIIYPYELDILIPENQLAIEYCELYWHSEKGGKDKNYHKTKLEMCNSKGIRLLTIFEDEWIYKEKLIKEKLKSILGLLNSRVYARKTQVINVTNKTKKSFFDTNHIQGNGPGSITYGLIYDNELVACMTFIKRKSETFELNRYATSCNVVGGFSKLLKHFQRNHFYNEIISFADLRWSEGDLYEKTGWKLDKILPPDYEYIINNKRYHKFGFRHKHLEKKLSNYNPSLTEKENMEIHGIPRIWNCGLKRYVITKN